VATLMMTNVVTAYQETDTFMSMTSVCFFYCPPFCHARLSITECATCKKLFYFSPMHVFYKQENSILIFNSGSSGSSSSNI